MKLLERTWKYIQRYRLIRPGETVLTGFSGGADSVCLLLLLEELGRRQGFAVWAVHVNHNLRGEESDRDQAFAEEFCRERGIPLHVFSCPVKEMAEERRIGIEEAGREARSRVFRQCMQELGAEKTALAHHRNDQAETVLFRLARGSSLTGLSGIRPSQGNVIHPILFAEKEEILQELKDRGVDWRTDSSNLTDHYTRNCIRLQVMPVLEERVNDRSSAHIAEAAEDIAEADQFLRRLAEEIAVRCLRNEGENLRIGQELLREEAVLRRYVLMEALDRALEGKRDLGREQLRQLQDLLDGEVGRRYSLPGELEAVREYEGILLKKREQPCFHSEKREQLSALAIEGEGQYSFGEWKIECSLLRDVPSEIPQKTYTKWLDYDKIRQGLEFRTRRPGDFLVTAQTGGSKKLKSYFIDEKIPAAKRGKIPLLAAGSRIFWVVGHRISEDCKITEQTEQVLKITVSEEQR